MRIFNTSRVIPVAEQLIYSLLSFSSFYWVLYSEGEAAFSMYATVFAVAIFMQGVFRNSIIIPLIIENGDEVVLNIGSPLVIQGALTVVTVSISLLIWCYVDPDNIFNVFLLSFGLSYALGQYEYIRRVLINGKYHRLLLLQAVLLTFFSFLFFIFSFFGDFSVFIFAGGLLFSSSVIAKYISWRLRWSGFSCCKEVIVKNKYNIYSGLIYGFYNNILIITAPLFYVLTDVAAFNFVRLIFQPVAVLISAYDSIDKNNLVTILRSRGVRDVFFYSGKVSLFFVLFALLYVALVYFLLPKVAAVFGYAESNDLIVISGYYAVFVILFVLGFFVESILYVLKKSSILLRTRLASALSAMVFFLTLNQYFGVVAIAMSMAISWLVIIVLGLSGLRNEYKACK